MRENDILFFNLHRRYINNAPRYGGFLGTFILAAFMNQNGYDAQGYAGSLMEGKKLLDEACQNHKVRMIDLYCDYDNVTENIFLSRYIKENYNIPVLVGGPQATALGEAFLDASQCDAIGRYEGEMTVLELANYFLDEVGSLAAIDGIMFKREGQVIITPDRAVIENLDALPFIDEACYLEPSARDNELSIMTGRGCPFHCAFCHEGHHTKKVRFRSVENVLEEIDIFLKEKSRINNIYVLFSDDTFTLIPERVKTLCEGLKVLQKRKPFQWFCEGHIHTLYKHPEMITYIAEAGARRIQLGIEAGTQEVLDAYRKGSTLEEIRQVVQLCRDAGIEQIYSNIILGGAFYTQEVYEKNLSFAKELISLGQGAVEIGVVSYWPLPDTSITNHPDEYNLTIVDKEFLSSVGDFPQVEPYGFNRWEILNMMQNMEKEIKSHMLQMLQHDEIPLERILSWFPDKTPLTSYGIWWEYLCNKPELFSYYQMLASGETCTSQGLEDTFFESHPMRTMPIYKYVEQVGENIYRFFTCTLDKLGMEALIYATGKLSVREIVHTLHGIYPEQSEETVKNKVIETFHMLEQQHLLVYSIY